jgi:hypothetical protein
MLLGRYVIPPRGGGYQRSGQLLHPYDYLVGSRHGWLLSADAGRRWWSGDFGQWPLPVSLVTENIAETARRLSTLADTAAPLSAWLAVSPLLTDIDKRLEPYQLDRHIDAELPHVQAVSRDPHSRLRTEHMEVPVGRARRTTWRTVVHLAANSQTWAARRLHGVEPARLLNPVRMPDYEFYENQLVAALIDLLWRHVQARAAELDTITESVTRAREFLDQVNSRPGHRERDRLYNLVSQMVAGHRLDEHLTGQRLRVAELGNAAARLLTEPLRTNIRAPYVGPPQRRPTNLFVGNSDYRGCGRLWDAWIRVGQGAEVEDEEAAIAEWCRAFAHYTALLVVRALDQLAQPAAPGDATPGPQHGEPGPLYRYRDRAITLSWQADDTFTISLEQRPVLRIVPLPHALTRSQDPETVEGWLTALAGAASGPERTAVIYPGEPGERVHLPLPLRLAVHDSFGRGNVGRTVPPLVPVSPADIDSLGRVARLLRGALDDPAVQTYPESVPCTLDGVQEYVDGLDWIELASGNLVLSRLPRQRELSEFVSGIANLRSSAIHPRQREMYHGQLKELAAEVREAVDRMVRLTTCPWCLRAASQPHRTLQPRDHLTYRCECEFCGSVWETRRCVRCGEISPVLVPAGLGESLGGDGDRLDRWFAQDLLAPPCWIRPRSYICTRCGYCPASEGTDACERCTSLALTGPATGAQ